MLELGNHSSNMFPFTLSIVCFTFTLCFTGTVSDFDLHDDAAAALVTTTTTPLVPTLHFNVSIPPVFTRVKRDTRNVTRRAKGGGKKGKKQRTTLLPFLNSTDLISNTTSLSMSFTNGTQPAVTIISVSKPDTTITPIISVSPTTSTKGTTQPTTTTGDITQLITVFDNTTTNGSENTTTGVDTTQLTTVFDNTTETTLDPLDEQTSLHIFIALLLFVLIVCILTAVFVVVWRKRKTRKLHFGSDSSAGFVRSERLSSRRSGITPYEFPPPSPLGLPNAGSHHLSSSLLDDADQTDVEDEQDAPPSLPPPPSPILLRMLDLECQLQEKMSLLCDAQVEEIEMRTLQTFSTFHCEDEECDDNDIYPLPIMHEPPPKPPRYLGLSTIYE